MASWRLWLLLPLLLLSPILTAGAAEPENTAKVIVVGGDRDYPPYEFLDNDGKPSGYNVELTKAIAEVMGLRVEFRLGD